MEISLHMQLLRALGKVRRRYLRCTMLTQPPLKGTPNLDKGDKGRRGPQASPNSVSPAPCLF